MSVTFVIFKSIGVLEVVFGALNVNKEVNTQATNHLAKHAFPMTVTFHKMKQGIPKRKDLTGELFAEKIGIPPEAEIDVL